MYHTHLVGIVVLKFITFCFGHENQILKLHDENSIFYLKHALCEKIASGQHLTDLTCVTMARLPVFGYVKHTTDGDKVSICWRCGPDVVGVPDTFTEKEVWAAAMPAQYLIMETTVGNVIIGEGINATMQSGASVVTDPQHGQVLYMNGTDGCVTAEPLRDFTGISVTLRFKMTELNNSSRIHIILLHTTNAGDTFRFRCFFMAAHVQCHAKYHSLLWSVYINKDNGAMLDQWVHLGVTWGYEEGMVVYLNGVKGGEFPKGLIQTPITVATDRIYVGCMPDVSTGNFVGLIDDISIWKEIVSPAFMKAYFYN